MLVVKEHKKLLLNLSDPGRVTGIVPEAKSVNIKGHPIVSVPHNHDVVRVLRNVGIRAPGPILYYYDWPGRFKPFDHQRDTAEFASLNPRAFILNDMGTGKTLSVLWAFDYLRRQDMVDWALIVSPLSTLERVWADEVFKHFPEMSCGVLHGTAERRLRIARDEYDVYVVNHDGIKNKELLHELCTKPGRGLVIVDELGVFRNAQTDRWKALNVLVNGNKKLGYEPKVWAWGLTGTPIPNEPTDAWAQCKLIRPGSVSAYFNAFRDRVMKQLGPYKWVARRDALDTVFEVMQPSIRFSREECIDLPPTTYTDRVVELTREQAVLYKQMLAKFKAEFEGGQITAANEAVKIGKLMQIVCGVAYSDNGDITIPAQPRTDTVLEIIEEANAKVIVFVPLTGALNALAAAIRRRFTVSVVHGGVPKRERDDIFADFQSEHGSRVLVAQPATMAHGLSLTAADTIVWYAPTTSSETYQQANARIVRPGQKRNTLIVRVQGSDIERRIYDRLEQRGSTQGALLGMF